MMRQKPLTSKKHMNSFALLRYFRAGALPVFAKDALLDGIGTDVTKGRTAQKSRSERLRRAVLRIDEPLE
jgi:hypothetical protein